MPLLPTKEYAEESAQLTGALPNGEYLAHITKSELQDTKGKLDGTNTKGTMLLLHFTILEGKYKGRTLLNRLNILNDNPVAESIANAAITDLRKVCQAPDAEDSEELHQIPMTIDVKLIKATSNYPESNEITAYHDADGAALEEDEKPKKSKKKDKKKKSKKGKKSKSKKSDSNKPDWL